MQLGEANRLGRQSTEALQHLRVVVGAVREVIAQFGHGDTSLACLLLQEVLKWWWM